MDEPRHKMLAWLREQKAVDFVTTTHYGQVILVLTKDDKLVQRLQEKGATAQWYDRTWWSTHSGKEKARQQCEVLLGPAFWARQEEEAAA